MTTTNFRKTLIDIAKNESDEHKIAKIIAFNYPSLDLSSKEGLFESLMSSFQRSENQEFDFESLSNEITSDNIDVSKFEGNDYRIKEIEISNLRGIPSLEESNGIPYGINFIDDNGNINNAIILANNGTGKSSIFAGLEMIYAQEIGEKKLRSINPGANTGGDYNNYLQNINNQSKPVCNVKTVYGEFSLDQKIFDDKNLLSIFQPAKHFISEYDIISNGWLDYSEDDKSQSSFHKVVAASLGLDEFLHLQSIAQLIPSYRRSKETSARNAIEKEIENNILSIKNKNAEIQSKRIELEELKKGISTDKNDGNTSKLELLNKLKSKIFSIDFDENNYRSTISEFENKYINYSSKARNKKVAIEQNFLNAGNELLHDFDNCPFCLSSNKSINEIRLEVETRLKELDEFQNLDKGIKDTFRKLSDSLWNNTRDLSVVSDILNIEREELASISGLEKIRAEVNRLYITLTHVINDTELNDYIYSFTQKLIPAEQDYKNLYNLIGQNKEVFEGRYIELAKEISNLIDQRKSDIENQIKLLTENNSELTVEQKINVLEQEIKELQTQMPLIENRNKDLEPELKQANIKVNYLNRIKNEIEIFNTIFKIKIDELVKEGFLPIKETVEEILNDYFNDDPNYKLEINMKEEKSTIEGIDYISTSIVAEIVNIHTKEALSSPQQYFNAFRFKLFCLMISISIALASRKKYKVNLPLVMDDLFFASDFINKNSFAEFSKKIISLFYKHTPDMELQFILFTHDDTIFRASIDGIETLVIDEKPIIDNSILGRIFKITDKNKRLNKFDDGRSFNDLLYTIPKKILIS